jgi:hypothetical protein
LLNVVKQPIVSLLKGSKLAVKVQKALAFHWKFAIRAASRLEEIEPHLGHINGMIV